MLNDFLYKSLQAVFGSVLVENEGVSAAIEKRQSLYETDWDLSEAGEHGEQYRVNCPFCRGREGNPDSKHHLYISYLSYSRPVVEGRELAQCGLLAHCFRGNCMADWMHRKDLDAMIHAGMACVGDGTSVPVLNIEHDDVPQYTTSDKITLEGVRTWCHSYVPCSEDMPEVIRTYLEGRGITQAMMDMFHIGWGQVQTPRTGRLLNNGAPFVIVPVIMNGKLRGVQARCPDALMQDDGLRYWIHPGMRKKTVVYNLDNARQCGVGVVCEGVFDVFKVGLPGVCCFGHTPSLTQKSLLETLDKGLILLPDTDVREDLNTIEEARQFAMQCNADGAFPLGAHVVTLPEKDPGCMDRQSIWTCILSQVSEEMSQYLINNVIGKL